MRALSPGATAVLVGAVVVTVLVASCGNTRQASPGAGTTTATKPVTTVAHATSAPTTAPSTTATTGGKPPGGPVPPGFDPVSFTAISASEYWLLGLAPCSNPVCTSIVRTTDGGAHFSGVPAPTSVLDVGNGASGGINTLRFADALDGYAFDDNPGGAFWSTHDGGAHWAQPAFMPGHQLLGFGTGAGYAFALVASCPSGNCSDVVLERSPVTADQWTALAVPVTGGTDEFATMTVHGTDLWFSLTTSSDQANQLLVASTNSGASFVTYQSPCFAGLAGTIQASSANVLWAVCPTGMMAEASRSTDGGAHWEALSALGQLENSAFLAPASDMTAVIAPSSQGQLLRTDNGGATWRSVPASGNGNSWWAWIGFTDGNTGSALKVQTSAPPAWPWPNGPSPEGLWRTSDGGTTWSGPVIIS